MTQPSAIHEATRTLRRHRRGLATALPLFCAVLISCGGSDDGGTPATKDFLPPALSGQTCAACEAGTLTGTASAGAPLVDSDVRVIDSAYRSVTTRTDAQGRYTVSVAALKAPFVIQLLTDIAGKPLVLHSLATEQNVGRTAVNLTPLTELITMHVLRRIPQDAVQAKAVDFGAIGESGLTSIEERVERRIRPVLTTLGAGPLDLRSTEFTPGNQPLLNHMLALLDIERTEGGYRLAGIAAPADAIELRADEPYEDAALPALEAGRAAMASAAVAEALPGIGARLGELTRLFAERLPAADELRHFFTQDFTSTGLSRDAFIERVLRRSDPDEQGGYSLIGARFDSPRILEAGNADRLLVRFRVHPRDGHEPYWETFWFERGGSGWRMRGDEQLARVRVRVQAVLGPRALSVGEVKAMAGVVCAPAADDAGTESCTIEGGQGDVPAGGVLDLGSPTDDRFGVIAYYRSRAATADERRTAAAANTRLLAQASSHVANHVSFEVDARRVDGRVKQIRVNGPGLAENGISLAPDPSGRFDHWPLAAAVDQDWHALRIGWCPIDADAREKSACLQSWQGLRSASTYTFQLLDADGTILQTLTAALPAGPAPEADLFAERALHFARFDLAQQPGRQPTASQVFGAHGSYRDGVAIDWPWTPPDSGQIRSVEARIQLERSGFPASGAPEREVRRLIFPIASSGRQPLRLNSAIPARAGYATHWLALQLHATDRLGNRYTHFVAPNNPY